MTDQSEWTGKVGNSWAHEWERTDRSFIPVTERLMGVATASAFAQAADIGCGAGDVSVRLAEGHPSARITGIDVSTDLLEVARRRGEQHTNLRFEQADAACWTAGEGECPDLLISRHGVMFFEDPIAAFAHLREQASAGARLVFSCFRERADNGWVGELTASLPPTDNASAEPESPGPFAFGSSRRVEGILAQAGWRDIAFEAVDYGMIGGEGENAVDDALSYFLRIGPAARVLALLDGAERAKSLDSLRCVMERHLEGGKVALPAACWIVTARAPD